jgi:heme exporter protein CcmD
MRTLTCLTALVCAGALAAADGAQIPVEAEPDFRTYVWAAYGLVLALLALFTLLTLAQQRRVERQLGRIEERIEHAVRRTQGQT